MCFGIRFVHALLIASGVMLLVSPSQGQNAHFADSDSIVKDSNGDVTVTFGGRMPYIYERMANGDETLKAPRRVTITRHADDTFTIIQEGKPATTFNAVGLKSEIMAPGTLGVTPLNSRTPRITLLDGANLTMTNRGLRLLSPPSEKDQLITSINRTGRITELVRPYDLKLDGIETRENPDGTTRVIKLPGQFTTFPPNQSNSTQGGLYSTGPNGSEADFANGDTVGVRPSGEVIETIRNGPTIDIAPMSGGQTITMQGQEIHVTSGGVVTITNGNSIEHFDPYKPTNIDDIFEQTTANGDVIRQGLDFDWYNNDVYSWTTITFKDGTVLVLNEGEGPLISWPGNGETAIDTKFYLNGDIENQYYTDTESPRSLGSSWLQRDGTTINENYSYCGSPLLGPRQNILMEGIRKTVVGDFFTQNRLQLTGYIDMGFEIGPNSDQYSGRIYDALETNRGYLDQIDLTLQRALDWNSHAIDWGFKIDLNGGADARYFHSNGLFDQQGTDKNELQFDPHQAYVDLLIPLGDKNVGVTAGKWEFWDKPIDPTADMFYTRPLTWYVLPSTETGIYGTFKPLPRMTLDMGISRGSDQSLKDNNGTIDYLGRLTYDFSRRAELSFTTVLGPETAMDNSHWSFLAVPELKVPILPRTMLDLTGVYTYTAVGSGEGSSYGTSFNGGSYSGYGVTGEVSHRCNSYVTPSARLDWYRQQGFGMTTDVYSATLGASIFPLAGTSVRENVEVRPEVRYDLSSNKQYFFDYNGTRNHQITFAVDAIFKF